MDLNSYSEQDLDQLFELAYNKVSETHLKFPQDVLLYFYAYYKHAKNESDLKVIQNPINEEQLVNAFKANAMFQVKKFSERESKIKYIKLAQRHLGDEFSLK
ncbi:acyl-CoA-binding protein [Psychroflexus sp. YR1-1]|uniref:Acyl-CoA-binding protein n=1 Tax=Psychroflexus aurantiacus TaxID=2709310 RepID=A0A6B3QZJ5_9FLAO|nr:acyl-CoA-binding protein [Psychroflexus aurantiacus]NEV93272.1 acyl-CoA-binding protein [Psychroflexus aurantiacus]